MSDELEHWRLCDVLSLEHAAELLTGYNPSELEGCQNDTNFLDQFYRKIMPFRTALIGAVKAGTLKARIGYSAHVRQWDEEPGIGWGIAEDPETGRTIFFDKTPNWSETLIGVEELKRWLREKQWTTGFFFPDEDGDSKGPAYLDPKNDKYAPKLAAAVNAWTAVANDPTSSPKTPKQRLVAWLTEHAGEYGLTKDDGKPNGTGIDEIAKAANWSPDGPSKTPQ